MVFRVHEKNDIFWSERGSGFGEPGDTPPPRISRSTPPPGRFRCKEAQVSPSSKKKKHGQKSNERKYRDTKPLTGLCHEDTAVLGQLLAELMA